MKVTEILAAIVAFDTVSRNSNRALVDWTAQYLREAGARVRVIPGDGGQKANLLASFGPQAPGGIVFSAHTDVVPVDGQRWSSDPFQLTERDGRFYGRGTADMKGFVACCLAAARVWGQTRLERPIHLAFSHDEESDCHGVPGLVDELTAMAARPAVAVVGEPTGMRIADRHRGFLGFRTTFHGQPAHSSDPAAGISAISAAARFVRHFDDPERSRADGHLRTTYSVGLINGGTNINIVPGRCEVTWEIRPAADADVAALRQAAGGLADEAGTADGRAGAAAETEEIVSILPLRPIPDNPAVDVACELGGLLPLADVPFGTEAGFFQAAGIPTVICGPGSISQAHQPDEWIAAGQLRHGYRFLAEAARWARSRAEQYYGA
jgi:acetylornithine deacetylase